MARENLDLTGRPSRVAGRVFRFAGGVAAGLAIIPAFVALLLVGFICLATGYSLLAEHLHQPRVSRGSKPARPTITLAGRDVTHAKGAVVILQSDDRVVRQDCRDVCDDVTLEAPQDLVSVRILDAKGDCVLCRENLRIWFRPRTWMVAGQPKIALSERSAR